MGLTREQMATVMDEVFKRCEDLREVGQNEYAHKQNNAFRNFESVADYLGLDRERVLLVYAIKHMDGITSHMKGHNIQRDSIFGRICDLIVYLCLLAGMIVEKRVEDDNPERAEIAEVVRE